MPRLNDEMELGTIGGMKGFGFSGVRIEHLGATEYTLVTIAVDVTGSVSGFENELRRCLIAMVMSCKKSPRSNNLLLRVILFSSRFAGGVYEVHGFKLLSDIDPQKEYQSLSTGGGTPLFDACYSAIGAMNEYGKKLADDDFGVNAIAAIITDGDNTHSVATEAMIKEVINQGISGEILESLVSILIGINATLYKTELENFQLNAGITQFIDAGDVTEGKLAKLAEFVSQSVISQSQALGTGGPSQNIPATI